MTAVGSTARHVTVKDDGVSANDDKLHAGASQKLEDVQGIVRT